jgi:hypothetical protein
MTPSFVRVYLILVCAKETMGIIKMQNGKSKKLGNEVIMMFSKQICPKNANKTDTIFAFVRFSIFFYKICLRRLRDSNP